ncbi:hypothetical protein ACFQZI_17320 [Mucilaginibacter lutimaris]|uniref:Uncharacterized protein n=1 Tax=Mucilaginibacter lutimaris TaxID=931629 RepID=A0ABW2ZK68_9SPHI
MELWITTQDKEITIGFEGKPQLNDWHTRVTSYDLGLIDNDIKDAIKIIENIINDKEEIACSNINGYTLFTPEENPSVAGRRTN